jgi:hypothetical protein
MPSPIGLRSVAEKTPTRNSPGETIFETTSFPAASPAGPIAALIGVKKPGSYPISMLTPATSSGGSLVRVMGRITCSHGFPVAEPRSTIGSPEIIVVVVGATVVVVGATVVVVVTGAHSIWHARHVFLIPACVGTSISGQSPGSAAG